MSAAFTSGTTAAPVPVIPPKPAMVRPSDPELLPKALRELRQWILWLYVWVWSQNGKGRWTKVPYQIDRQHKASTTDPSTWVDFDAAYAAMQSGADFGLGFVFGKEDGFCGIDFDRCLNADGTVKEWARDYVEQLAFTYLETSPSGTGIKAFTRANLKNIRGVEGGCRGGLGDGEVEIYNEARFFTLTGKPFNGAPPEIEESSSTIRALLAKLGKLEPKRGKNGNAKIPASKEWRSVSDEERVEIRAKLDCALENLDVKFRDTYNGSAEWYRDDSGRPDPSAADCGFYFDLADMFRGDPAMMYAAFMVTPRGLREKAKRIDYHKLTLAYVLENWEPKPELKADPGAESVQPQAFAPSPPTPAPSPSGSAAALDSSPSSPDSPPPAAGPQIVPDARTRIEKLNAKLQEAIELHLPSVLLEAKGLIQCVTDSEYADFRAAVRQAKNKGLLDIDVRQIDKIRREGKFVTQKWNNAAKAGGRPHIIISNKQLLELRMEAISALQKANQPEPVVYRRDRDAVRYGVASDQPYLERLDWLSMRSTLSDAALFYADSNFTPTFPPRALAEDLLACSLPPDAFPEIVGVQSLPIVRADGSICTVPGYDTSTKLVYHAPAGFRLAAVPDRPTADDVEKAKEALLDLVVDFPFETLSDRTNFFAFLLTLVIRCLVPVVPMALFGARDIGSGKGLLVDLAAIISTGDVAAAVTAPASRAEWTKLLFSLLSAGRSFISFDNVRGTLESDALEGCLTKRFYQSRILGRSEERVVINNATWSATANNAQVSHDLARRCYPVNLDAKVPNPFLRTNFKHGELVEHCKAERADLVWSLLVLIRNGFEKRATFKGVQLGTFHKWRTLVGGTLAAAGLGDFLGNQRTFFLQADNESELWEQFLLRIHDVLGDGAFTAAQLGHAIHLRQIAAVPAEVAQMIYGTTTLATGATEPNPLFTVKLAGALGRHLGTRHGVAEVHLQKASPDPHLKVARYHVVGKFGGPLSPAADAAGDVPLE